MQPKIGAGRNSRGIQRAETPCIEAAAGGLQYYGSCEWISRSATINKARLIVAGTNVATATNAMHDGYKKQWHL
jgi:hypothetical protein